LFAGGLGMMRRQPARAEWLWSELLRMITKQQYRKLMSEYQETGKVSTSAMKAGMSRPTAQKYLKAGQPPAELQAKHTWRTRSDPLAEIWPTAQAMLREAPELEAKALFEYLMGRGPWVVQEGHLRTFQRRVKLWRLQHGPDREVFFPQDWEPGRALQLDWTNANELGIRISGVPCEHLLCHCVLPYSNWEWATRCQSESLLSLRHGLQEALFRLGKVPRELRVDNSSAATHRIGVGAGRQFNQEFRSICEHYGLKACTINVDSPNENGDVESGNGHFKRRLHQHLLLRGSRDFEGQGAYDEFVETVLHKANGGRQEKLTQELAVMKPLPPTRLSEYEELYCRVSSASTIRVKKVGYSVPARLIGQELKVEVYESKLKLYSGRELLFEVPRQVGDRGMVLNYRHVIEHLLRKPGAFERYRYREQMFPSAVFRHACDWLVDRHGARSGGVEYLRLLKLASEVGEQDLELLLIDYLCPPKKEWSVEQFREIVSGWAKPSAPVIELTPEWGWYDSLLSQSPEVVHAG
jgi:hypothetical protein